MLRGVYWELFFYWGQPKFENGVINAPCMRVFISIIATWATFTHSDKFKNTKIHVFRLAIYIQRRINIPYSTEFPSIRGPSILMNSYRLGGIFPTADLYKRTNCLCPGIFCLAVFAHREPAKLRRLLFNVCFLRQTNLPYLARCLIVVSSVRCCPTWIPFPTFPTGNWTERVELVERYFNYSWIVGAPMALIVYFIVGVSTILKTPRS